MKITNISISNYLGIATLDVAIANKVLLVAGFNGAGKSSVAEAVKHALTANFSRVGHKKDLGAFLHDGAAAGHAILGVDNGAEFGVILPSGANTGDPAQLHYALDYTLTPSKFAASSADERRALLFKVGKLSATPDAIAKRLAAHGLNETIVSIMRPHLSGGFTAANKQAAEFARDSKAAWRVVTGETYGAVKAETWQAPVPAAPATVIEKSALDAMDLEIDHLNRLLGEAQATQNVDVKAASAAHAGATKLEAVRAQAATFAGIQDQLNHDETELASLHAAMEHATHLINGAGQPCPHCGGLVQLDTATGQIVSRETIDNLDDVAEQLAHDKAQLAGLTAIIAGGKRELAAAESAAQQLAALESLPPAPTQARLDELSTAVASYITTLAEKRAQRDALRADYDKLQQAIAASEKAASTTTAAAKYHADVVLWEKVADLLAPSGILAEMMADALNPINKVLRELSLDAGWPQVRILDDMDIYCDNLHYALRSESEQWRADAIIAAAIATLTGAGVLMLDRFDVLDIGGRRQLFDWLAGLQLNNIIVLGTMKTKPVMPDFIQVVWLSEVQQ